MARTYGSRTALRHPDNNFESHRHKLGNARGVGGNGGECFLNCLELSFVKVEGRAAMLKRL